MRLKFAVVHGVLLIAVSAFAVCGYAKSPAKTGLISEDLIWTIEQTTVSATITLPDGRGPFPAVVFVAGSGPTDRDWNSKLIPGTNGSGRLLAEELSKNGFAVLRYDKRFTGPYAKGNLALLTGKISLQSHIEELASAAALLRTRSEVDPKQIFVLTNSEGAIHALNYQLQRGPGFAGLVLTAAQGRRMKDALHSQIEAQVAALPNAKEFMEHCDKLVENFLAERPFVPDPVLSPGVNYTVQSFYNPLSLPFTREILSVDPAVLLEEVSVPTLAIIGKKDIQFDWQVDGAALEKAAHGNVVFAYPENANHVLKYESKPRSELSAADGQDYNAADKVLDPETLNIILDWLKSHASPVAVGSEKKTGKAL